MKVFKDGPERELIASSSSKPLHIRECFIIVVETEQEEKIVTDFAEYYCKGELPGKPVLTPESFSTLLELPA